MNILLVIPRYNPTNKPDYKYMFPLGLSYISSVLKKAGYSVDCLNLNHLEGKSKDLVDKALCSKKYNFVCTGGMALHYMAIKKILDAVRCHNTKPITILGGLIITAEPELIFESLKPDFGIIGEGEETILDLLDFVKENKDLKEVKGIIYRLGRKNVLTEKRKPIENLDSLPLPDFEGLGFEEYLAHTYTNLSYFTYIFDEPRPYPILASRSCPFQCTFCYHDTHYRQRSLDNVMGELNVMVRKYKINSLIIYDDCFATKKERLIEFCKGIKQLRSEITWELKWTCQLMVNSVDRKTLKMMKDAGCFAISYGFESFSPVVLKSMRKYIIPKQIDVAFKETLSEQMFVQANFIFGDVAETKKTAMTTINYWKKNCKGQVNLAFIQPYPGSQIYQHCLKEGIIKDKLDFIKNKIQFKHWFNMTETMTNEEVKNLKNKIASLISEYYYFVSLIWIKRTGKKQYSAKIKCPFCKETMIYKNLFINNVWTYSLPLVCRKCYMKFFVVAFIIKILFKHNSIFKSLIDHYVNLKMLIKNKIMTRCT